MTCSVMRGAQRSVLVRIGVMASAMIAIAIGPMHSGAVFAQTVGLSDTGFSVERFIPPPGPTPFLGMDHADVLPHLAYSAHLATSLMSRPIVLRNLIDQSVETVPVDRRWSLDLSFAMGLGKRFQLGLAVPVIAYQTGDRLQGIGLDETPLASTALGDIRIHSKARFIGRSGDRGPAVAAGLDLTLPSGDDDHFAGERGTIVEFRMLASYRQQWFSTGLQLGARLRTQEVVLLSPARPHGNELTAVVGVAANIPGLTGRYAATVIAEYAYVRGDSPSGTSTRGPSPGEVRAGVRLSLCTGVSVAIGGGAGTTPDEVGSPAWRLLAGVRYDTTPIADIDHDGLEDGRDQCRQQAEDRDGFEDSDGCPDIDNDRDGYPDSADECPDAAEDFDGYRDVDGCPEDQHDTQWTPDPANHPARFTVPARTP